MKRRKRAILILFVHAFALGLFLAGCNGNQADPKAEAPPPAQVEREDNSSGLVQVDHPEQFPLYTAVAHEATPELNATGVVSPVITRTVPVISIATRLATESPSDPGDNVIN